MNYRRLVAYSSIGLLALFVATALFFYAGARINFSRSLPLGLYWAVDEPLTPGTFVMFCPPPKYPFTLALERGYLPPGNCKGRLTPMFKIIVAAAGDTVTANANGVTVNGQLLPMSKPIPQDGNGDPMPAAPIPTPKILAAKELLLMTDSSPTSFDARYFGIVQADQITTAVRPVYTWR